MRNKQYLNYRNINYINEGKDDSLIYYEVYMANDRVMIVRNLENTYVVINFKHTYNFKDFIKYIYE